MVKQKNILICPLDWGLGHTTRCIPIITILLEQKFTVFVACTAWQKEILNKEIKNLNYIDFFGYNVNYNTTKYISWAIIKQIPKLLKAIKKEHLLINKVVTKHNIDLIISDNRFGCYSQKIPSVFITHQTQIKTPFFAFLVNKINRKYINNYSQCWIPDFENHYLSGNLSTTNKINNAHFIYPLSRFKKTNSSICKKYKFLFLLSGPEPQRSYFEKIVVEKIIKYKLSSFFIVRGLVSNKDDLHQINTKSYSNYCSALELEKLIQESELIICRSGYSSVMDLYALQANAFFIPTPGQTEQEYLAYYLKKNSIADCTSQNCFLKNALILDKKFIGFSQQSIIQNQKNKIVELLSKLFLT